jgi:thiamine-phosphate pyrophosphorylase
MERAGLRILDANFNRAREAVRVIEDYCRFALNSQLLTERAKQLRHELCAALDEVGLTRLASSRDSISDVGVGGKVPEQFERSCLKDSFTAGCKRLTEALRALEEVSKAEFENISKSIEKMRFDSYTLEKDIIIFSEPAEKFKRVSLYVIISSNLPADIISLTHHCAIGGADCIQLRAKNIDDEKLSALAVEFVQICREKSVLSIINDRVDIAVAAEADGVHLGQNDIPIDKARKLPLTPLIIGKSTHSATELENATVGLPTYVSLGPVFPSSTKPELQTAGLEYVRLSIGKLEQTGIAGVAIGGITLDNLKDVLEAGAKAIAVCSVVNQAKDPAESCRKLREKIIAYREKYA